MTSSILRVDHRSNPRRPKTIADENEIINKILKLEGRKKKVDFFRTDG
jgi:hypothetical protein